MKKHVSRMLLILGAGTGVALGGLANAAPALDLVYIGDSITAGAGLAHRDTQAPPVIATRQVQKQIGPETLVFMSNQGRSGYTTVNFLPGGSSFSSIETAARALATPHPGELVFSIMLGTNDSANSGPLGSPIAANEYSRNLEQIIDKLIADFPGSKFLIHHPIWHSLNALKKNTPQRAGSDYSGDRSTNRLKSYFPAIDSIVANYSTAHPNEVYVGDTQGYDYFAGHQAEFQPETGQQGTFYLHPDQTGATSLGGLWADALVQKLQLTPEKPQ
jgi:lysophospholipase L1-like esterase